MKKLLILAASLLLSSTAYATEIHQTWGTNANNPAYFETYDTGLGDYRPFVTFNVGNPATMVLDGDYVKVSPSGSSLNTLLSAAPAVSWTDVTDKPTTFAPSTHNHDSLYYTKAQMDTSLGGKAASSTVIGTGAAIVDTATNAATDAATDAATNAATNLGTSYGLVDGLLGIATAMNSANAAQNDLATKYNALATKYNAAAAKLNAATAKYNDAATKLNTLINELEARNVPAAN